MSETKKKRRTAIPRTTGEGPSWIAIIATGVFQVWPVTAVLLFLKLRAMWKNKRLDAYRACLNAMGDVPAVSLRRMAGSLGKSEQEVSRLLTEMISRNYLGPEAYIDYSRGMLYLKHAGAQSESASASAACSAGVDFGDLSSMIGDIAGIAGDIAGRLKREFTAAAAEAPRPQADQQKPAQPQAARQTARPAPEKPAESAASKTPAPEVQPAATPQPTPAPNPMDDTLKQLKALNDEILDQAVSDKIDRIAALTRDIYSFVALNPEREIEVHKFMNYYLPTTMKLLKSYSLLERQSYQGENIVASRHDIEEILGTLVHAFEKQLDQLFAADAVDISSDITVLETMIAKDGLSHQQGVNLHL